MVISASTAEIWSMLPFCNCEWWYSELQSFWSFFNAEERWLACFLLNLRHIFFTPILSWSQVFCIGVVSWVDRLSQNWSRYTYKVEQNAGLEANAGFAHQMPLPILEAICIWKVKRAWSVYRGSKNCISGGLHKGINSGDVKM